MPALVKKAVVLDVIVIEIIGERVKPVPIVSALEKNCGGDQTAQPSIAIVERMYGGKEKVRHQAVEDRRKTEQMFAVDESNVSVHQTRKPLWRRSCVKAAYLRSSYLNGQSPQRASILVVHAGLIRDHPMHGENVVQGKRGAAWEKTRPYPSLGPVNVPEMEVLLANSDGNFLGPFFSKWIGTRNCPLFNHGLFPPLRRTHKV